MRPLSSFPNSAFPIDVGEYRPGHRPLADLTRPLEPVETTEVELGSLWPPSMRAIFPAVRRVIGQRLTYTQVSGYEVPDLFERIAFGGTSFGLTELPYDHSRVAELVPVVPSDSPRISPSFTVSATEFRCHIGQIIERLYSSPRSRRFFVRKRDRVMARVRVDFPMQPDLDLPWYLHLPVNTRPDLRYKSMQESVFPSEKGGDGDWPEALVRPVHALPVEGAWVDGRWRHGHVAAIFSPERRESSSTNITCEQLKEAHVARLVERVAFAGLWLTVADLEPDPFDFRGVDGHNSALVRLRPLVKDDLHDLDAYAQNYTAADMFQRNAAYWVRLARCHPTGKVFLALKDRFLAALEAREVPHDCASS